MTTFFALLLVLVIVFGRANGTAGVVAWAAVVIALALLTVCLHLGRMPW